MSSTGQSELRRQRAGFTLLEVLVALVIVSLGMIAVQTQIGRYALTATYMEEQTLASWIGTNKVVELSTATFWPDVGASDEELEFAERQWVLEIDISETQVENLRRVDVDVALADAPETVIQRVSGLLEPPAPQGFVPVRWLSVSAPGRGP